MVKAFISFTIAVFFIANQLQAKSGKFLRNSDVNGIYLSAYDFKIDKPACQILHHNKNNKIRLNLFFNFSKIDCKVQGLKTCFLKDSIFCIRMKDGACYRFINGKPCLLADTSFLYVYEFFTTRTTYILSGPHRRKKNIPVVNYYFSAADHRQIHLLKLDELKKYVQFISSYTVSLDKKFTTLELLLEVNPKTKHLKLNDLLLSEFK